MIWVKKMTISNMLVTESSRTHVKSALSFYDVINNGDAHE